MRNVQKSELSLPFCVLCFNESIAEDSTIGGQTYYPTHKMRMQMGIWDASGEAGSASWAKGPIDWNSAPGDIRTLIHSVKVEC